MINTIFLKRLSVVFTVLFLVSCDKDYNTIGLDMVDDENFVTEKAEYEVVAYNQKTDAVQTDNLPINQLGIYNDPVFGTTRANFVTQLALLTTKPTFNAAVIDSVVLTVPYFSKLISTNDSGRSTYELKDSIYYKGKIKDKLTTIPSINLKVYENGYNINNVDPNGFAKYYSNQDSDIDNAKIGIPLNDNNTSENISFIPDAREINDYGYDDNRLPRSKTNENIKTRTKPSMRLHLSINYFKAKIIDAAMNPATSVYFENQNNFNDYLKGIYFQVASAQEGAMYSLDFSKGNITIYYEQDNDDTSTKTRVKSTFTLNMTGTNLKSVNLLNNTPKTEYLNAINNANSNTGDDRLYVKGGEGSMVYIDIPNETIKKDMEGKIINDASLTFTIDKTKTTDKDAEFIPNRIYLYDATNNTVIVDYSNDGSTNTSNSKQNKAIYGGIIQESATDKTLKYKIRLTNHINNIINHSGKSIRLGLVVTENINDFRNLYYKKNKLTNDIFRLPLSSITSPFGTVLYGSNISKTDSDYAKRVKLEIRYTKPN